ncbi:MAG: SDR family oxidoreductase [Polyangiaceae bacterium]
MSQSPGKVVVITGASAGIGRALAELLAKKGYRLVLAARRAEELEELAKTMLPTAVATVAADVTRRAEVERIRDVGLSRFGHIDVWINNVGRGITRPVLELTDEDIDEMIQVNVKSALYGMQAILPYFKERGAGHLINVSSFLGRVPLVSVRSAYSAAKAALNSLTASVRVDLAKSHPEVRVSLVMPGMVATEFAKNAKHAPPTLPAPPPGAAQTKEEVAEAIASLLENPRAEVYTNGEHAHVAKAYYDDVSAFEERLGGPNR